MLIPILTEPLPDELFYSYLARLSKENNFLSLSQFVNAYFYLNSGRKRRNKMLLSYDANTAFSAFSKYGYMTDDPVRFYLDHSIYGVAAPFMTPQLQTKMINNAFRPDNVLEDVNNTVNTTISELRFCPECAKKDLSERGTMVYYRKHNLPGVMVCPEHHVPLMTVTDTQTHVMERTVKSEPCTFNDEKTASVFADYSARFLIAEPDVCISDFAAAVSSRLHEMGLLERAGKYDKLEDLISGSDLAPYFDGTVSHFMKVSLVSPRYVNRKSAMALSMLLFPDPEKITDYVDKDEAADSRFASACKGKYEICGQNRNSILEMIRTDSGEHFITTKDGFLSTWREYSADYGKTSQQKFEEVFRAAQDGSYTLLTPFLGMNTPVTIKHTTCGRTFKTRPRNFIEDGRRCECENRVSFKQAENLLQKKAENFILLSFEGTDKEAAFLHNECGKPFTHVFRTFLDHPNCPYCTIRYMHKDEDMFKRQIKDLTGDEYSLVSAYVDKDTRVKIRHNKCGKVFECLPRHFTDDGQRCPDCTRAITDTKFSELVQTISKGKYAVQGKTTANLYRILNTETGAALESTKARIMQELLRPTPSDMLPLDGKGRAEMPVTTEDKIMEWLHEHYSEDELIFLEDIRIPEISYKLLKSRVTDLVNKGKLYRIGFGILAFHRMELTDQDLIRKRYLIRHGHREGILYGESLAYELGVADKKPDTMQVLTNKESSQTGGRTKKIGSVKIRLKGSEFLITDFNYKALELLNLVSGQYHYGWDMEKIKGAVKKLGIQRSDIEPYKEALDAKAQMTLDAVLEDRE